MEKCIFCKIASHEIGSNVVFEDEKLVAFKDINPAAPVHIVIIPKAHITGVLALREKDKELIGDIILAARKIAGEFGIAEDGFRIVTNSGPNAGQSVAHLHFHLLGGRTLGWPPG
jgi:histidine triad (HIT) family protein